MNEGIHTFLQLILVQNSWHGKEMESILYPQTAATTAVFSSVFILRLCDGVGGTGALSQCVKTTPASA